MTERGALVQVLLDKVQGVEPRGLFDPALDKYRDCEEDIRVSEVLQRASKGIIEELIILICRR